MDDDDEAGLSDGGSGNDDDDDLDDYMNQLDEELETMPSPGVTPVKNPPKPPP